MSIFFYSEENKFKLSKKRIIKKWIYHIIKNKGYSVARINIIFTRSAYLKKINFEYLNHNYFTDVVTFTYSTINGLEGEIYIDYNTVKSNSKTFNEGFTKEICRTIIHGVFHMMGYNDSNNDEIVVMRNLEDEALNILRDNYEFRI